MKIGIDARAASHPQAGGYKTYITNLLKGLGQVDGANDYVLYLDGKWTGDGLEHPNFDLRILPTGIPYLGAAFREQWTLPRQMRRDGVDVAHFPYLTAPLAYRGKYCHLSGYNGPRVFTQVGHTFSPKGVQRFSPKTVHG